MKLNGWQRIVVVLFVLGVLCETSQARAEETSHLMFVTEYIRELAENEDIRANTERELNSSTSSHAKLSTVIHSSKLLQLELRSQIENLKGRHLNPPFEEVIPSIINSYEQKIVLYQEIIDLNSSLLANPQPGANYSEIGTEMPKIRAQFDYINKTLFLISPLVFATLIDQKPDSKNRLNHLIITKKEKEKLLNDLKTAFGKKLEQKDQKYAVSSAAVLRTYLTKDYKCSDEPWE